MWCFFVPTAGKPPVKLTPLELAVGEELTKSRKRRRELIDMSYHRLVYLLIIIVIVVLSLLGQLAHKFHYY